MLAMKDFRDLNRVVDAIFKEADDLDLSNSALAKKAGLSYRTVLNLDSYTTLYPRSQTVMMLARAVGMKVVILPERQAVKPRKLRIAQVG